MFNKYPFILAHLDDDPLELKNFERKILSESEEIKIKFDFHSFTKSKGFLNFIQSIQRLDFCILDIILSKEEEIDGISLIANVKNYHPNCVIVMYSFNDHSSWVFQALSEHVHDFFSKKIYSKNILQRLLKIQQNLCAQHLMDQNRTENIETNPSASINRYSKCIGKTLKGVERRVQSILPSPARCILIEGESGTGKEVVADLFEYHMKIQNIGTKFMRLNCASLAHNLIESELFGYKKGAFTGALQDTIGFIEAAENGILMLDEISTLSIQAQSALLRAIENQEIIRIGDTHVRKVNVRFLCISNIPLADLVQKGLFRNDLWQRLQEVEIYLPPLRERKSEIVDLIDFFCQQFNGIEYTIDPLVKKILAELDWSDGNVRELRNVLRAMTEFSDHGYLGINAIPKRLFTKINHKKQSKNLDHESEIKLQIKSKESDKLKTYEDICDEILNKIFEYQKQNFGKINISQLAKDLNISRTTLYEKLKNKA